MNLLRRKPRDPGLPAEEAETDPELAIHHSRAERAVGRANAAIKRSQLLRKDSRLLDGYAEAERQRQAGTEA